MRLRLPLFLFTAALAVLAACSSDAPAPPTALTPVRPLASLSPTACEPEGIRGLSAVRLQTSDLKPYFIPTFNEAEQLRSSGNLAGAYSLYLDLAGFVVERLKANRLTIDRSDPQAQADVNALVGSLLACAGVPYPAELDQAIRGIARQNPFYQICPATDLAAPQTSCRLPEGWAAVVLPQGFLARKALVLMQPGFAQEGRFEDPFGTTWSGVWRIRIVPAQAQANHASNPPPATPVNASTALCVIERYGAFHPTRGAQLRVAQADESAPQLAPQLLEPGQVATPLLGDCHTIENYPAPTPLLAAGPLAPAGLGDRLLAWSGDWLGTTGRAVAAALQPTPLYAFDGGIGGVTGEFTSYFAGVERPALYIRYDLPTRGALTTLPLATLASTTVYASRTEFGDMRAGGAPCTWTSSHNRVSVAVDPDTAWKATLTASRSQGEATVTASCLRNGSTFTATSLVTVSR